MHLFNVKPLNHSTDELFSISIFDVSECLSVSAMIEAPWPTNYIQYHAISHSIWSKWIAYPIYADVEINNCTGICAELVRHV